MSKKKQARMIPIIEPHFLPGKKILNRISLFENNTEITELEAANICGLIQNIRPHKILEIGVYSGVTTAILMKCIDELNLNSSCEIISVGKDEEIDYVRNNHTGFLINESKLFLNKPVIQKLILKENITELFDNLGTGIDLVVINPKNIFPDTQLAFLSAYPHLSDNAYVIIRGINPLYQDGETFQYASLLLMNSLVAEKITLNISDNHTDTSNIGVLLLNNDTKKYIADCFNSLFLPWQHIPSDNELSNLHNLFCASYREELVNIFDASIKYNRQISSIALSKQSNKDSNRICNSYKIGLAITFVPRRIRAFFRKNRKSSDFEHYRLMLRKKARKTAKRIHLKEKSYIFSDSHLKAKFYLPNIKDDFIQQTILYHKKYFENDNLLFVTKEWCNGIIGEKIQNNIVLDIGSNIGNHTLFFILECNAKMVHCFEPIETTFQILKRNVSINHVENHVCLHNYAAGKCLEKASIAHYEIENIGGTSLKKIPNGNIDVVPIDNLNLVGNICLVKIDVEGFEKDVIDGMIKTIETHHPFVMIEIQNDNFSYVQEKMQSMGYCYICLGYIDYLFFYVP